MSEKIGFVGVGLMGHGMATNILKAGYQLTVLGNRNREPVEDLIKKGAREAKSARELAEQSDIVFMCLPGSPQIEATVRGKGGLIEGLKSGSVIIDCSTADPTSTASIAEELAAMGVDYADAPLGGTPVQAAEGTLSAMIGAKDDVFKRIEPVVEAWSEKITHIGGVGDGHRMKLLNNFVSLGYASIYSEALALAKKVGITPDTFDSVIRGSRMDCGFYQTFMGYAIEGNFNAHKFTLTNALKDMRYLESMADDAGISNPMGNATKNSFAMAVSASGGGAQDYVPHMVKYIGTINGVDLAPKEK